MSHVSCHCIALRKAGRRISSYYDGVLAPLGVNIAQFSLLRNIRRMAPVSLSDLGAKVELDRSTLGRNTKVLERMGLVGISPGKDQREALLVLTDRGRKILQDGDPLWEQAQQRIEDKLGKDGINKLHDLLASL